jgi:hypothetical protein
MLCPVGCHFLKGDATFIGVISSSPVGNRGVALLSSQLASSVVDENVLASIILNFLSVEVFV